MRARVHADEKDRFAQHILKTGGVTIPEIGLPGNKPLFFFGNRFSH